VKFLFTEKTHIVNFVGAIVSGLCVGFILAWTRSSGGEIYFGIFIKFILLAICSYLVVALLLPQWKGISKRKVPNWVIIAIIGSLINFLSVNIIPDVEYIWRFKDSSVVGYASGAIREEFIKLILSTFIDSLIALPIMGTIHYVGYKARTVSNTQ